jgi:hypothetical protein
VTTPDPRAVAAQVYLDWPYVACCGGCGTRLHCALDHVADVAHATHARVERDVHDLARAVATLADEADALRAQLADALARADAAEAQAAALAGAVGEVGDLIAEHGCSCDCDCTHTTGEHTSECDPCLACRASDVVSPLLRGAHGGYVRASVVREYVRAVDAYEAAGAAFSGRPSAATRATECEAAADLAAKRTALDAALAAAGST